MPVIRPTVDPERARQDRREALVLQRAVKRMEAAAVAVRNHVDLLLALGQGAFESILGTTELEDIEFKTGPYRLQEPRQKWELAKDVAALANQRGGVIVLGYRTERSQNQLLDTVTEHRPVPKNLVSWDAYRGTVSAWVRPPVEGLEGRWFPTDERTPNGVFTLTIPAQPDHSKYFVVCHMVDENGSFPGAIGVPVRRGDAVEWLGPDAIQALLREAVWWRQRGPAMADPAVQGRIAAAAPREVPLQAIQERIEQRVAGVEATAGWQETPFFALHAVPDPPAARPDDFYANDGVKGRLASPNVLRPNGFHIQTYADPAVLPDGSLQCATDRRILWLSTDGFFTAAATGSGEFLGWFFNQRRAAGEPIALNPRVASEYVLEFCRFVHAELKPRFATETWTLWLSTVGFDRDGGVLLVPSLATAGNNLFFRGMARNEYIPVRARTDRHIVSGHSAAADAYRLIVELYATFAAPPEEIAYAVDQEISERAIVQPEERP